MAKVQVDVGINASKFSRGLDQMRGQVASFGNSLKAIAGLAAFGAGASFFKGILDDISALKDSADQLGMSTEAVQRLTYAFAQGGADQATFVKGATRLAQVMQDVRNGSEEAAEMFGRLGISAGEVAALDSEQMILRLAEAISASKDPTLALSSATEILGKSGARLVPILKEGSDAMREYMGEATILTDMQAKRIEASAQKMENAWTRFKNSVAGGASAGLEVGGVAGVLVGGGGALAGAVDALFGTKFTEPPSAMWDERNAKQKANEAREEAKWVREQEAKRNGPFASKDEIKQSADNYEQSLKDAAESEKLLRAEEDATTAAIQRRLAAIAELATVGEDAQQQMTRLAQEFGRLMEFAETHADKPALAAEALADASKIQVELARLGLSSAGKEEEPLDAKEAVMPKIFAQSLQQVGGGGGSYVSGGSIDTTIMRQASDVSAIHALLSGHLSSGALNESRDASKPAFMETK